MNVFKEKKENLPLFGKYLPTKQRQQRFIIGIIIFIVVEIVKAVSFLYFKQSMLHSISFISMALCAWLLGFYAPVVIGLLTNYIMSILIDFAGNYSLNPPFQIITISMMLIGCGIGLLVDLFRKSRLVKQNLSEKELLDQYFDKYPLWGKYLSHKKRKNRLILFIVICCFYVIIQTILFLIMPKGIVLSLNFIPITVSGWLLGIYGPIITGLLSNFHVGIIIRVTQWESSDHMFGILQAVISVLIGCMIGKLSELITKSRITEEQIKKTKEEAVQANMAKSEFLACMSHEIRTPINSIMGFAQLLKEELDKPNHIEKIEIILKSGKTLLTLINDILDLSKIEAGEIEIFEEEFSLRSIFLPLNNIFYRKAKEKKLEFSISINHSVPEYLYGDERRIQQIVSNLINNAVKFTDHGSIKISAVYEDGELEIRVIDTGIGIPKEMQEAIFTVFKRGDPSLTRAYSGTGLGLAITKRLVIQMGGSINVESEQGKGSCFTVKLPLKAIVKDKEKHNIKKSSLYEYTAETINSFMEKGIACNVLVAEDNESNRLYIHELLSRTGIFCDFAKDGRQTIEMLEEKMDTDDFYDLLILDIQMPILSGIDVIQYIRKADKLKDIYCIAITAHALKGDERKYIDAGCDAYLAKPIEIQELYRHIVHRLEQKENISSSTMLYENLPVDNHPDIKTVKVSNEQRLEIQNLIERLKNNYRLYNKQELLQIREKSKEILPQSILEHVDTKIHDSIKTYDDEILLEVIELLEVAIGEKPTGVHT